jgi:hypothetical protein
VESVEAAVPAAGYRFCAGDTPAATAHGTNFYGNEGTIGPTRTETSIREGSLIRYENVEFDHSGIASLVRRRYLSRSESGENFGSDRSSRSYAAGGEGINGAWLG